MLQEEWQSVMQDAGAVYQGTSQAILCQLDHVWWNAGHAQLETETSFLFNQDDFLFCLHCFGFALGIIEPSFN